MHPDRYKKQLRSLLAEPLESVRERERTEFDRRMEGRADSIILFGAGNLGRRVLSILRQSGQEPVAFIDNNPALWGQEVEGLKVLRPSDAAQQYKPEEVAVVVTIWCGEATDKMLDRVQPLKDLGFTHIALFGHLAWKHPELFLPHYSLDLPSRVLEQADKIEKAFDLFQDERSREIFVSHIKWRLHLDYDALPSPVDDVIYFNDQLIRPSSEEVLVDGGAYVGDTIESFLATFGTVGFKKIVAFEPDPENYKKLTDCIGTLPADIQAKIEAFPSAVGEHSELINVEISGGPSSRVGHGEHQVSCHAIDELFQGAEGPTFIKMDIEGFEPHALRGAATTIPKHRPVVAACVYHVQDHVWSIPLSIAEHVADYRYTLVPHLSDGWDLVLYAVPVERVPEL